MNLLPIILNLMPGISPQWKQMIAESGKALSRYKNTKQDLLRAVTERNLRPDDIRQGLKFLTAGPVATILNTVRPGSAQQLHELFSSIADEDGRRQSERSAPSVPESTDKRKGNPFPALN